MARLSETLWSRDRNAGAWARAVRSRLMGRQQVWHGIRPPATVESCRQAALISTFTRSRQERQVTRPPGNAEGPDYPARGDALSTHSPVLLTAGWTGRHRGRKSAPITVRHHGGQCTSSCRRGVTILECWIPSRTSPHERRYCRRHRGRSEFCWAGCPIGGMTERSGHGVACISMRAAPVLVPRDFPQCAER